MKCLTLTHAVVKKKSPEVVKKSTTFLAILSQQNLCEKLLLVLI